MDYIGHALYGATLCSRKGLAGGRRGAPQGKWARDWTVWAAVFFSLLPDTLSMGIHFVNTALHGDVPTFHGIPPYVFVLYHYTHSLLVASVCALIARLLARPLALPALAWPAHILIDAVLHNSGRWQSPMLFPLSAWHVRGVNWWQHPALVLSYWTALPLVWLALHFWRRRGPSAVQRGAPASHKRD